MLDHAAADFAKGPPPYRLIVEMGRAACRLDVHRETEAARDLEAAWKAADTDQMSPVERAQVEGLLAQALEKTQPARALEYALKAQADVAHDESGENKAKIDEIVARLRKALHAR